MTVTEGIVHIVPSRVRYVRPDRYLSSNYNNYKITDFN